jgi:hypothetical protein
MSINFINYSIPTGMIKKVYANAKQLHLFANFVIASLLINYKI